MLLFRFVFRIDFSPLNFVSNSTGILHASDRYFCPQQAILVEEKNSSVIITLLPFTHEFLELYCLCAAVSLRLSSSAGKHHADDI